MEIPIPTPKDDEVLYCTILMGYSINYNPKMFARFGTLMEAEAHIKKVMNRDLAKKATKDEMACLINEKNEPIVILEILDLKIENGEETRVKTTKFYIFDPESSTFTGIGPVERGKVIDVYNERIKKFNDKMEKEK